jgi:hypothetical protein
MAPLTDYAKAPPLDKDGRFAAIHGHVPPTAPADGGLAAVFFRRIVGNENLPSS